MAGTLDSHQRVNEKAYLSAFGRLVRSLRTERGYSQEKFVERCGSAQVYISEVERGLKEPCLLMILRLAEACDTTPVQLMVGVEVELQR